MIKVDQLSKQIPGGPKVLSGISFNIEPGEFIAVKGASGSGKSMLLRCLAMRESWSGGSYIVDGVDILKKGLLGKMKIRREIAYLEEKPTLIGKRTALKNVLIGTTHQTPIWRRVTGMIRSDDYMGAMDMIEKMGLLEKAHQKGDKLSGGEKQRIAMARALVHGAKTLLTDEPVSGLDPHAAEQVLSDLKKMCQTQGISVVAVMHQGDWAERFADRIIGLNNGKLVLDIKGRKMTEREKMLL
ncbi:MULTISPECIES: phosphonate ABC transporter ATP-binding protein [Paenibacillus]|uniref:ATP-binding cassette domain-containing protein n=1 Tax=Paenibacillus lignilyticus TaxID=1172615 RepID=A0ABS5CBK2_9BACL|nr:MULTISPECIES: ATP-binding cassette domain-containing protein [Paenibacillus]MBP3963359.1 ATP-binding cassette domain-containing protein [Paenibacillus lignilyticus]SFS62233.1 phosphonate transport system ATP-binding protein [Paenibacillus sp. BC26]